MKNQNLITKASKWIKYVSLALLLSFQVAPAFIATTNAQSPPTLSSVNDQLEDQTTEVARTGKIICRILGIVATVLLLANIVFKKVEQSTAIVTWFITIFIWGMMEILF